MLTQKQLEERRNFICGSDTGKIFGVCEWENSTPLDLWYEKKGISLTDTKGPDPERGNLLEPLAIQKFEELIKMPTYPREAMIVSEKYPWMGGHCDAICLDFDTQLLVPLEVKCPRPEKVQDMINYGIHPQYILQTHHYMMCLDVPVGHFFAYDFLNMKRVHYRFQKNNALWEKIASKTLEFHDTLKLDEPPEFGEPEDLEEFKVEAETVVFDSPELEHYCEQWDSSKKLNSMTEVDINASISLINEKINISKRAEIGDYKITQVVNKGKKTFDLRRFLLDHPEANKDKYWKQGKPYKYLLINKRKQNARSKKARAKRTVKD